uniref:DNA (cytosine-5-)-methyltransferase n=1 Tax=Fagus sylvatica TaxID=28930 RepID=A0A2N9I1X4_FAGSY
MAKSNKRRKDERDTKNEDELISSLVSSKRRKAKQDTENKDELISSLVSSKRRKAKQDTENKDELISSLVSSKPRKAEWDTKNSDVNFVGKPVSATEARRRWPHRYQPKAEDGKPNYIARIVELFESIDREQYFSAQWFYRAEDTVIKDHSGLIDKRRVFLSDIKDENPLNCIVSKVKIALVSPNVDLVAKEKTIPPCDLYYDMKYSLSYLTFANIVTDKAEKSTAENNRSSILSETGSNNAIGDAIVATGESQNGQSNKSEMTLLDLYSGCGAMSTGLCMGASKSGVKLVPRWAVDINQHACKSLKSNHPKTEVRNEAAEDFLSLLKEWAKLCKDFSLFGSDQLREQNSDLERDDGNDNDEEEDDGDDDEGSMVPTEEFEVQNLLAVCYGDPNKMKKPGLYFKVRWKGYGSSEDTWEPIAGLSKCKDKLREFVRKGYKSKVLPLPGDVDFICGGPPCQGVSGFNRFRNQDAPLDDVKNRQLLVFMDIIEYLKPSHVLMENVVDILKFAGGFLGRYAIGRLVSMNYQARLGMMAAGSYGLPQYRMRVFLWGACPTEKLPQYPLPTHKVNASRMLRNEFEEIYVGSDNDDMLHGALCLENAISDLPPVTNDESQDTRKYGTTARTEFQRYIRLKRNDMVSYMADVQSVPQPSMLYDHLPLKLNEDDFDRVCFIPKKKGANFRDLPGVLVSSNNKVEWDPSIERVKLPSGKPLVPDYAMSFVRGISMKPFGRLWWDEIVQTVVTRAEPHNQTIVHPLQDRVLTIRENARLQGFPDCYQLFGPVKERYIQVGNAVAVPVALALGYTFGLACQGLSDDKPVASLPFKFPNCLARSSSKQT